MAVAVVWVINHSGLGYGGDKEMSDSDYFVSRAGRT